jgi:hypothetical protein
MAPLDLGIGVALTSLGGVSQWHSLAQRLLTLSANTPYGGVMASPPTITVGASDANSAVVTNAGVFAPTVRPNSANVTPISGGGITNSSNNYFAAYINDNAASHLGASNGWGIAFVIPVGATQFDVCTRNLATSSNWNVRINNQWVSATDLTSGTVRDGAHYYYTKFSPVVAGDLVEVFFGAGAQIAGFNFGTGTTTSIQPTPATYTNQPNILSYGDSYIYGSGPTTIYGSWSRLWAAQMGVANIINSGVGGTGFIATNGGAAKKFIDRIADVTRIFSPDVVLVPGSLNDNGQSTSTLQTAVTTFFQSLGAAVPNALIVCYGIEHSPANNPSSSYDAALSDGFAAAGLGRRGKFFSTLNGTYQDTTDSSLYAADNTHPSDAGSTRYVTDAVTDFKAWLATL